MTATAHAEPKMGLSPPTPQDYDKVGAGWDDTKAPKIALGQARKTAKRSTLRRRPPRGCSAREEYAVVLGLAPLRPATIDAD